MAFTKIAQYLLKESRVTGQSFIDESSRVMEEIPDTRSRRDVLIGMAKEKADEGKTPWTTALGYGGGIGAGSVGAAGALAGLSHGGGKGGLIGGLAGAGVGGLMGALTAVGMKAGDDVEVNDATTLYENRNDKNFLNRAIANKISEGKERRLREANSTLERSSLKN